MVMAEERAVHAQVLYQYPEGKAITPDAAHFCFPHGVQPSLLERTPSMSALNELVYSQHYQHSDGASFIFVLKASLQSRCTLQQMSDTCCACGCYVSISPNDKRATRCMEPQDEVDFYANG